jgi:hypothetical protein
MSDSRTYAGVSAATWQRLLAHGRDQHGTTVEAIDLHHGTTSTMTPLGTLVLRYALDPDNEAVTYTIVRKPFFIGESMIWHGIEQAIRSCSGDAEQS